MGTQSKSSWIKQVDFMAINLISLIICFLVIFYINFGSLSALSPTWMSCLIILCLVNILVTLITNPYSGILRRPYYTDALKLFFLTANSFLVVAIVFYLFKVGARYSRITLIATFASYYVVSLLLTRFRKKLILSGKIKALKPRERNTVAVIKYEDLNEILGNIGASDAKEREIVGYCFPRGGCKERVPDGVVPVIAKNQLVDFVLNNHIDDVYMSVPTDTFDSSDYKAMIENGVNIDLDVENLIGIKTDDQVISRVGAYPTLSVGAYAMESSQAFYLIVKRVLDLVFGLSGCLLLLPLALIIKISYLLAGDTASIVYTQNRIGQFGKPFHLYKFRSMVPDADEKLEDMLKQEKYKEQWEQNHKIDEDPRITKIGKILRRLSLDEFPQFINVVKGEMSLIGPRPLAEGELEEHGGLTLYNKVKPGITGWWACNGRSNISYRERLELEYYYVKNCSPQVDALIVIRTIVSVLKRKGAR